MFERNCNGWNTNDMKIMDMMDENGMEGWKWEDWTLEWEGMIKFWNHFRQSFEFCRQILKVNTLNFTNAAKPRLKFEPKRYR